MSKQKVRGTHFEGPILGSGSSMAGALRDGPIDLFARSPWSVYFNDFQLIDVDYVTTTDWSLTQVSGGGSASILVNSATADIGVLRLDCPTNLDGPIVQLDGSGSAGTAPIGVTPAAATSGTSIATDAIFAARYRILDVSAQGTFVGLAELNGSSAVIAQPTGGITSDTHIGFHTDSTGAMIFTTAGNDDTAASTTTGFHTLTDSDWIEVAVRATGTTGAKGYVRIPGVENKWQEVASTTLSTGWDAQMLITMANIGSGAGDDLDVDYVMLAVRRDVTE